MANQDREVLKPYYWNHQAIRRDGQRLLQLATSLEAGKAPDWTALRKWFSFHSKCLHHHHLGEDEFFFPRMRKMDPGFASKMDELDKEHRQLDDLSEQLRQALDAEDLTAGPKIQEYVRAAIQHLDNEEPVVESVIKGHLTTKQIHKLEREYRLKLPKSVMKDMMPWMLDAMSEEDRKAFFRMVPFFVKWMYNGSIRKKYEELVAVVPIQ